MAVQLLDIILIKAKMKLYTIAEVRFCFVFDLALKPRGDVTRNPKQGYQWPQKGPVSAKNFFKKKFKKKEEIGWTQSFLRATDATVLDFL